VISRLQAQELVCRIGEYAKMGKVPSVWKSLILKEGMSHSQGKEVCLLIKGSAEGEVILEKESWQWLSV